MARLNRLQRYKIRRTIRKIGQAAAIMAGIALYIAASFYAMATIHL